MTHEPIARDRYAEVNGVKVGADKAAFLKRWDDMNDVVYQIVLKYGGSVSAEHGVGIVKRDYLPKIKDPTPDTGVRILGLPNFLLLAGVIAAAYAKQRSIIAFTLPTLARDQKKNERS